MKFNKNRNLKALSALTVASMVLIGAVGCNKNETENQDGTKQVIIDQKTQALEQSKGLWGDVLIGSADGQRISTEDFSDIAFEVDASNNLFVHQYVVKTNTVAVHHLGTLIHLNEMMGELLPNIEGFLAWRTPEFEKSCNHNSFCVEAKRLQLESERKHQQNPRWRLINGNLKITDGTQSFDTDALEKFSADSYAKMKAGNTNLHQELLERKDQALKKLVGTNFVLQNINITHPTEGSSTHLPSEVPSYQCGDTMVMPMSNIREVSVSEDLNLHVLGSKSSVARVVPTEFSMLKNLDQVATSTSDTISFYDSEKCDEDGSDCQAHNISVLDSGKTMEVKTKIRCVDVTYVLR